MPSGSAVWSSGRLARAAHRRMMTSRSALSQIETRLRRDAAPRLLAHEGAAAGRQHDRPAVEQARDHAAPRRRENTARRGARRSPGWSYRRRPRSRLSASTKPQAEPRRQPPADGRLADAHHADQHDRTRPQRRQDVGLRARLCWQHGVGHRILLWISLNLPPKAASRPPIRPPRGPRQRTLATKRRTCWMISLVNLPVQDPRRDPARCPACSAS